MKTKNWYDQVPGPSRLEMRNNDDDNDDENTRIDSFKIVFINTTLSFESFFNSISLAESPPRDLQITVFKIIG